MMERLVCHQLQSYVLDHKLLSSAQSAFRPGHNTQDVLVSSVNDWLSALDRKHVSAVTFLDVKKAFDCVNHQILLKKLYHLDIEHSSMNWFASYLEGRLQKVFNNQHNSSWFPCHQGVPQGSVLGPLLFSLYINDLPDVVKICAVNLFADDTCIYSSAPSANEAISNMNSDLDLVFQWFEQNKLSLNLSKTKSILIANPVTRIRCRDESLQQVLINHNPVAWVSKYKYLGVMIDEDLTWRDHIQYITSKAYQRLALLRLSRSHLPRDARIKFYKSLVQPVLEYSCVAWSNCSKTLLRKLLSIEGYAARIITNSAPGTRTAPLMEQLQLHRLVDRLDYFQAILTFRCLNNLAPIYLKDLFSPRSSVCSRITRNFFRLLLPSPRSNYLKRAFSYKGACHWNSLLNGVINLNSLQSFKVTYKKTLA